MTAPELNRLNALEPKTKEVVGRLIVAMAARGYDIYVGATTRTRAEVEQAVASGHSSKTLKRSWHELGRAADLRMRTASGGPDFDQSAASEPFWRALYEEAIKVGLRSLAYRPSGERLYLDTVKGPVWDSGHVEYRAPFATLRDALLSVET